MSKVLIIAEAGVNHNGSLKSALKLVDAAAMAGADAVKFQTFEAHAVVSKFAPKARYQIQATGKEGNQLQMIQQLQLGPEAHKILQAHCRRRKIMFLSTPFDAASIDLLNGLGLKIFKIPSGEITNLPYLRKIGALRKKIILSTGMADLREIREALRILTAAGTRKAQITLLHCNSAYPSPFKDANLLAIPRMKSALGMEIGYSDHTLGIEAAAAAVALGAVIIEKHLTLDKRLPGPDHKASLDPAELRALVKAVRNVESALGSGIKRPSPSETANITHVRKSIIASRDIGRGERFNEENLTVKRPGTGLSPMQWDRVIGRKAVKAFHQDELIKL